MKQVIVGLLIIAVIGIGLAYASGMNKNNTQQPPASLNQTSSSSITSSSSLSDEVQTINVEAGSFYYKPNEITVKKGQKVKIVMNSVSMMHDFVIDELGVKMPIIQNGNTGTIEFTPQQTGQFEYYCSVGNHRANGMVGKLIVE